jgi:hypothetical protein
MNEGKESLSFQWKDQVRERCALKLLREEWALTVRFPVDDDGSAGT